MRKIILLLILLLFTPLVFGMNDCKGIMEQDDIPCMIITTWDYPNPCNTYTITFYDNVPLDIGSIALTDYGSTGRCNTTFNFTSIGSYIFNVTGGDSGHIAIEVSKMMNITIFGIMAAIGLIFIILMHIFKQDNSSPAYGWFAAAIFFIVGALGFFGMEIIKVVGYSIPFDVNKIIALVCFIIGIYAAWFSNSLWQEKKESRSKVDEFSLE